MNDIWSRGPRARRWIMAAEGLFGLALTGLSLSVMSGRNGSGWGVAASVAIFIAFLVRRHTLRLMFVLAAAGGAMQLVDPHAFIIFGDFLLYAPICAELGVHRDARVRRLGLITGAPFVLPRLVAIFGRLLGAGPDARIARRNAVADPMRTTRATLGLVIGVGLVTTFASGSAALSESITTWDLSAAERAQALDVMHMVSIVMIALVVIASIIAGVGFVSTMSLVVIQRRREIGMLRAMGFTARQIRGMVTRESLALGLTAVLVGIALGVLLGSLGAQSLIGAGNDGFVWGLPFEVLAVIVVAALALVLVAALPPARRATTVTPGEALRVV
ncbi:ABC transporter permease [Dermacoccus nishinomiyaensis]|uniref:ABC transporter permease n=1 Tax=Dermacoccus nishinomiyaensis TaxID=1274 RepID=UPI0030CB4363